MKDEKRVSFSIRLVHEKGIPMAVLSPKPSILEFGYSDLKLPSGRSTLLTQALQEQGFPISSFKIDPYSRFKTLRLAAAVWRLPPAPIIFLRNPYFLNMVRCAVRLKYRLKARLVVDALTSAYEVYVENYCQFKPGSRRARQCQQEDELIGREADLLIVDTKVHGEDLVSHFCCDPSKMLVVPVGTHFERRSQDQVTNSPPYGPEHSILFIGSFIPVHGVEVIVEAARQLQERSSNITFRLIGDGRQFNEIKQKTEGLSNVRFLGAMSIDEGILEMRKARLMIGVFGTSHQTQLVVPFKVYAALAMGKPFITARTAATETMLTHGVDSWLVPPGDPKALADAIVHLVQSPELLQKLGDGARQSYRTKFDSRITIQPLAERLMALGTT